MIDSRLAPILVLVYNRPEHTRRLFDSLKANPEAAESCLYVYSDAAKDEASAPKVAEVRAYIHGLDGFGEIHIEERTENRGLAPSVIEAVTRLTEHYGRVIVLEDDLVVSPYFLRFMNEALDTYQDDEKVAHIMACDYTNDPALPETYLVHYAGSWGWATWQRAWKQFEPDGNVLLAELERRNLCRTFDFNGCYRFTRMLRRQIKGEISSWAVRWNATLLVKGLLALNAGRSLVLNEGFDGSGVHCGGGNLYASVLSDKPLKVEHHPIEENTQARACIANYYRRNFGFWPRVWRRLNRTLHGDFGK